MYFWCISRVFPGYFPGISRVFPGYFPGINDVKSMHTSVFITCNIKIYMIANIYMTCARNSDALLTSYLAGWDRDPNRRTSASESDTIPTELLGLDYLTTTYTVLISCTCEEKSVVL